MARLSHPNIVHVYDAGAPYLWTTGESVSGSGPIGEHAREGLIAPPTEPSGPDPLDCIRQVGKPAPGRRLQGSWIPSNCEDNLPFVCEQVDWFVDPRTDHAYRIVYDKMNWAQARQTCERMEGHLATITSKNELELVGGQVAVEVWIGATDVEKERSFVWVNKEPFEFQAFVPGELDHLGEAQPSDCVVLGADRLWHDRRCHHRNNVLCEVE